MNQDKTANNTPLVSKTAEAFGYEWTTHGDLGKLYGEPLDVLKEFATFKIPDTFFADKKVLDAGCGMGRWSWCAAQKKAGLVYGFDLHDGVKMAKTLNEGETCIFFKGNIFSPPFAPDSFDSVFSIGVIHHTGDTRRAFATLAKLVKPGGQFFIQVYRTRGTEKDRRMSALLNITSKLPNKFLYVICYTLMILRKTPLLKNLILLINHYVMIVSHAKNRSFLRNVADTFDWHC